MQNIIRYAVFNTKWGYFGLFGTKNGLLGTCLPNRDRGKIKSQIVENVNSIKYDISLFRQIQEKIIAYFDGFYVDFGSDIPIVLDGFSLFGQRVLTACRDVRFGETMSYSGLAERVGRAGATRAVGRILAKNPLPLIIPCHRVIRNDGKIGGFSAQGGVKLKKRMLELERQSYKH